MKSIHRQSVPWRCAAPRGFTLIELLVVIAIIGSLVGLLLPAISAARESSRRLSCSNNLKQIGLALRSYESSRKVLPAAYESYPGNPGMGAGDPTTGDAGPGWTYLVRIMPYIEENGIYKRLRLDLPCWDPANAVAVQTLVATYRCPTVSDPSDTYEVKAASGPTLAVFGRANYVANAGQFDAWDVPGDLSKIANGPMYRNSRVRLGQITDGESKTVIIGEQTPFHNDTTWVGIVPGSNTCPAAAFTAITDCDFAAPQINVHSGPSVGETDPPIIHPPNAAIGRVDEMYSEHPGGANVLFVDGHVVFVPETIDPNLWLHLSTMNAGDDVSEF